MPRMNFSARDVGAAAPGVGVEQNIMTRLASRDAVDWLPPKAALKLRALRDRCADHRATLDAAIDRQEELRIDRQKWQAELRRLRSPQWQGQQFTDNTGRLTDDHPAVKVALDKLRPLERDYEHQVEIVARHSAAQRPLRRLLDAIEAYCKQTGPDKVQAGPEVAVKLRAREGLPDAIEARRRRLRELKADRHRVESAPRPSAWAKQQARKQVTELAQRGAADCMALVETGDPIRFPTRSAVLPVPVVSRDGGAAGLGTATIPQVDTEAMLAWLHKDALIAALDTEIDQLADDDAALDDNQRAEALAEIERDRLATEREEETLIEQADQQGLTMTRRDDADPRAVLGINGPVMRI